MLGYFAEELGGLGQVTGGAHRADLAIGALEQTAHDLAAFFHQPQQVAAELLGIGDPVGAKFDVHGYGTRGFWRFFQHFSLERFQEMASTRPDRANGIAP